ncbi:unnamed protein product [Medioppia subpectinata]|uniref:Anoctamin n=1 Tax=Medioppia subpectinata TaxID=1979941 RepID=A0A7R9PY15_9ACAR|nr:unnamed protein product [Medioppia subpectinata]CAG2105403.1 unnamed protein product [Medioppia subpectinata]
MEEPVVPFVRGKLPHLIVSSSLVLLCVSLVIGIMLSVIAYRVSVRIVLGSWDNNSPFLQRYGSIITSTTAALINLLCILVFDKLYTRLAIYLTERELPRTQFEFDNSLTLKMFLFQFVNYYSSIFYIAFAKGRFVTQTGDVSKYFVEECPMGGCFVDLAIQLATVMVGKQAFGAVVETLTPVLTRFYTKWRYTRDVVDEESGCAGPLNLPQWEDDYLLESWTSTSLFYEYLELVLQFGFVTVFVSAFPLAPLFALVNNFFEIRFDAKKIITSFKRPVAQRVKSIGIWYRILDAMGKLSVITNAMIIAFTTSFVPRILHYIENGSYQTYLNSTLLRSPINDSQIDATFCVFSNYGAPPANHRPDPTEAEAREQNFWHLMVARLAFVVVFENVIVLLTSMMRVLIPDVPKDLRQQMRLHSYLTNELIMRQELTLSKRCIDRI